MLKKKICLLIFLFVVSEESVSIEVHPYFGVDQQVNRARFKHGYGENMFPKHHARLNVYSGLKFDDCISLELGYLSTISKSRFVTLKAGDSSLGAIILPSLEPAVFKSYIKFKGYHLSVVNTFAMPEWDHFRVLGGLGLIFLKADAKRDCISISCPQRPGNVREFEKKMPVLRVMVAPEYIFKNRLGIRASVCFLNTSTMKITAKRKEAGPISRVSTVNPTIRLKDSFVYSLGLFYEF